MMATAFLSEPLMTETAFPTADRIPDPGSPYHTPEVLAWVEKAQQGDQSAFGSLVRLFSRDVYGKAFSILKNHQDADDAVQETFIRVSWLSGMGSSQMVSGRLVLEWSPNGAPPGLPRTLDIEGGLPVGAS